jgi:hypothetical protein
MPYKRSLRLAFVATQAAWAQEAAAIAGRLGDGMIDARAARPGDGDACLSADLVLTLDAAARAALPALPARVRHRHLGLEAAPDAAQRAERIARRVEGILGGLRMMAR